MVRLVLHGLLLTLPLVGGAGFLRAGQEQGRRVDEPRFGTDSVSLRVLDLERSWLEVRLGKDGLKPYLKSLVTPSGIEVLRDAPPDHEHHHGLMLALGVDDVDFWGERYAEVPGRQRGDAWSASDADGEEGHGRLHGRVHWLDPRDGSTRLEEIRELRFRPGKAGVPIQLTWSSRLSVPEGRERVTLWGRPYFGLGLRFAEPFDRVGRFSNAEQAEGALVRGDERLFAARWCAYAAEIDERPVTVALFDHPRNPRHPARFFTMAEPFAYLSATLDLERHPLELERGEELDLCWGLAVWEAQPSPEAIEALYRQWCLEVETEGRPPAEARAPSKGD